ncbi:SGNH/GDSL hydrolase family protein [Agrococcus casei]|uniref:SGNH/GDSL hydrolase family protein n=1 Tax=Agrococcus casei TaxID=343512 RepID=UPI003F939E0E
MPWARSGALAILLIITVVAWSLLFRSHSVAPEATHTPAPSIQAPSSSPSEAAAESTPSSESAEELPVAVFVGASYATGAGATFPESRWTALLADQQGWNEVNLAQGGNGYIASPVVDGAERPAYGELVDQIIAAEPDVVVISGGRDDVGEPPFEIQQAATSLFGQLTQALPNTQIIVVNPWWDATEQPIGLAEVTGAVEAAAAQTGVTYLDTGQPLSDPALLSENVVDPNDQGHLALAEAVAQALAG